MKVDFLHRAGRLLFVLILTVVCCGHVYQSVHLHHFHNGDFIAFEVSSHPLFVAVDHNSTHHHHDDASSHESDEEHSFEKSSVWRQIARPKWTISTDFDFIGFTVNEYVSFADLDEPRFHTKSFSVPKEYDSSFGAIRGPPSIS